MWRSLSEHHQRITTRPRRIAHSWRASADAYPCVGLMTLKEFEAEVADLAIDVALP
jgi:hypothetical protein